MLPVLIGLAAAMTFGLFAHVVYGTDQIIAHPWIDMVFWALIATGALVSAMNALSTCLPCRVSRIVGAHRYVARLCAAACER